MKYEILHRPSYSILKIDLEPGEEIKAEAGALMMTEGDVRVSTKSRGILRALSSSESLFINIYRAEDRASIWLSPPVPGDVMYIPLNGTSGVIVNDRCYLADHGNLKHEIVWRGLRGVFGRGGLVWLHFKGIGGLWVNAYGAIVEKEVKAGEKLTIDNVHLVAMDDSLDYEIRKFGGMKSFILGGEGFVFSVKGEGRIFLQTRNPTIWYTRGTR